MKNLIKISVWCMLMLPFLSACSEDPTDTANGSLLFTSQTNITLSGEMGLAVVEIETDSDWTASIPADWATVTPASGKAGKATLTIEVGFNMQGKTRSTILTLNFGGKTATVCRIQQLSSGEAYDDGTPDQTACQRIHEYMDEAYLWNEAYRQYVTPFFNQSPTGFLNGALEAMYNYNANPLDGCWIYYGGWIWQPYSYIVKTSSTRALAETRMKSLWRGFGIEVGGSYSGGEYLFWVKWIYPDSPAATALRPDGKRLSRGDLIGKVDGKKITSENELNNYYADLFFYEHSGSKTVTFSCPEWDKTGKSLVYPAGSDITLTTGSYYPTPVLFKSAYLLNGKRIGYVVYNSFDQDYSDDIISTLQSFVNQGVTDIIFDLRYNGGGSVAVCRDMLSVVAGRKGYGHVFAYQRHNDERLAKEGGSKDDHTTYTKVMFEDIYTSASEGVTNVYVIATDDTASASELVINSLRGIDMTVKIVGLSKGFRYEEYSTNKHPFLNSTKCTNGKNVGMEKLDIITSQGNYELVPITFQLYNEKGESDYEDGFDTDIEPRVNLENYLPYDFGSLVYYTKEDLDTDEEQKEEHEPYEVALTDYFIYALQDINGGPFKLTEIDWEGKTWKPDEETSDETTRAYNRFDRTKDVQVLRAGKENPVLRGGEMRLFSFPNNDWRKTNMYW